ncbi:MAG: 2-hydroxyacid dehydrogenase [Clostridia bacterium]|nr:2-hydroxyacid dehydrogenase [Clostridia bacterium]
MKKIAFFDAKPYDKEWFDRLNKNYEIVYFDAKLTAHTAGLASGFDGVCAFVNDEINAEVVDRLYNSGIRVLAMRSAGYSNVDFKASYGKIHVVRVPAYSPHAIAEHAMGLLLTVNRKIHRAYIRTRDFNFSLNGLCGIDLFGKTAGVIGTGKIGRAFIDICRGMGMRVLAYDLYPADIPDVEYTDIETIFKSSDVISLHCPLTDQTHHMLNGDAFSKMKKGMFIINTSRGALIESTALLNALNDGTVRGAGLDVYEEEADLFFEDFSNSIIKDDVLSLLVSRPNVVLTSHQAFLTEEALGAIAEITLRNLDEFFSGEALTNEVCYQCDTGKVTERCPKTENGRCF